MVVAGKRNSSCPLPFLLLFCCFLLWLFFSAPGAARGQEHLETDNPDAAGENDLQLYPSRPLDPLLEIYSTPKLPVDMSIGPLFDPTEATALEREAADRVKAFLQHPGKPELHHSRWRTHLARILSMPGMIYQENERQTGRAGGAGSGNGGRAGGTQTGGTGGSEIEKTFSPAFRVGRVTVEGGFASVMIRLLDGPGRTEGTVLLEREAGEWRVSDLFFDHEELRKEYLFPHKPFTPGERPSVR